MKNPSFFIYPIIISIVFIMNDCKKESPVVPSSNPLLLTVEDATCTETFLKLSIDENEFNRTVTLKRDDSTIASIIVTDNDSLFIDEGLSPKHTYKYTLISNNWTATAFVTTMDTTSHNWSFTLETLGETNSYLLDVTIINESLAYAVGEIHIGDTLYNAAKWNGQKWELLRIKVRDFGGSTGFYPLYSVLAFAPDNVWFCSDADLIQWNGYDFIPKAFFMTEISFNGQLRKMWGTSVNNIYCIGRNGAIFHYAGSNWQKQESGTALDLNGIGVSRDNKIYICGLNYGNVKGILLRNSFQMWETLIEGDLIDSIKLFNPKLFGITEELWIDEKNKLYTVGNLMYQYRRGTATLVNSLSGNNFTGNPNFQYRGYLHAIDGNASNDLFIVGEINTIRHFNGETWVQIGLPYHPLNFDRFWFGCDIKKDLMIAAGKFGGCASVIIAKRKQNLTTTVTSNKITTLP